MNILIQKIINVLITNQENTFSCDFTLSMPSQRNLVSFLLCFWWCYVSIVSINVLIWPLFTSTGLLYHGELSMWKFPAWNFTNNFWHIRSVTESSYTAQIFYFLYFSCFFTLLEIIKHNVLKMLLFSSIFNIKIAKQKLTNFDNFF